MKMAVSCSLAYTHVLLVCHMPHQLERKLLEDKEHIWSAGLAGTQHRAVTWVTLLTPAGCRDLRQVFALQPDLSSSRFSPLPLRGP